MTREEARREADEIERQIESGAVRREAEAEEVAADIAARDPAISGAGRRAEDDAWARVDFLRGLP